MSEDRWEKEEKLCRFWYDLSRMIDKISRMWAKEDIKSQEVIFKLFTFLMEGVTDVESFVQRFVDFDAELNRKQYDKPEEDDSVDAILGKVEWYSEKKEEKSEDDSDENEEM